MRYLAALEGSGLRSSGSKASAVQPTASSRPRTIPTPAGRRAALAHNTNAGMKITDAKVIVCSPGRNFVTLKIVTEDGLTGLGDATLNGRELAVATYLSEHVVPLLIGRDARRIEDTWHYLYKGVYWRKGAVTMTAIAAVDMALWDIAGKAANKPVYQLFGGASREEVLVYCHANGATLDADGDGGGRPRQGRVSGHSRAVRGAGPGARLRRRQGRPSVRAGRARRAAAREHLEHRALSPVRAGAVRAAPARVRLRDPAAPRRPSPAAPDRGRAAREEPRAVSPVLDGRPRPGRAPGGIPHDPAAHDDADCRRRSLRQHL